MCQLEGSAISAQVNRCHLFIGFNDISVCVGAAEIQVSLAIAIIDLSNFRDV